MTTAAMSRPAAAPVSPCQGPAPEPLTGAGGSEIYIDSRSALAGFLQDFYADTVEEGGLFRVDEFSHAYWEDFAAFADGLGAALAGAGVDTGQAIELDVDEDNRVVTATPHPDGRRIEALLAARPDLTEGYRNTAVGAFIIASAQLGQQFEREYLASGMAAPVFSRYQAQLADLQPQAGRMTYIGGLLLPEVLKF